MEYEDQIGQGVIDHDARLLGVGSSVRLAAQRTGRSAAGPPQAVGQTPEITVGLYGLSIAARCDPIHESRSSDAEPGVSRKISATVVGVALGSPRSD